jgi:hypothetical protein
VHPIVAAAVLDGRHVEAARLNHLVGVGEFSGSAGNHGADGLSDRWRARLTENIANRMRGADPELTTINDVLAHITELHGAPFVEKHEVTQQHAAPALGRVRGSAVLRSTAGLLLNAVVAVDLLSHLFRLPSQI